MIVRLKREVGIVLALEGCSGLGTMSRVDIYIVGQGAKDAL